MNVLYGAGKLSGSNLRLSQFIANSNHNIKCLAHFENAKYLHHIDWLCEAIYDRNPTKQNILNDLLGFNSGLFLDHEKIEIILEELYEWKPDLVISDWEPISCALAKTLSIPLWSCSPANLLYGVKSKKITSLTYLKSRFEMKVPEADRKMIYSPFCDILDPPTLKDGFEWVKPYSVPPICTRSGLGLNLVKNPIGGETEFLAHLFYNKQPIYIFPSSKDLEGLLNAITCESYNIGLNFWDSANLIDLVQRKLEAETVLKNINYLNPREQEFLHEKSCA